MTLRCSAWLAAIGRRVAVPFSPRRRAVRHHPLHRRHRRRRRDRSLCAHRSPIRWRRRWARPSSSKTSPARTATSLRSSLPTSRPTAACLDRHSGFHRDQSQRLRQPALVDRRLRPFHPRRRGAAGVRRAPRCAGRHLRRVPRLGEGEQGQAQLFVLPARHAVALPRLPAQRKVRSRPHPRALSRVGPAGDRAAGRGHSQFGFAQVNSRCRMCAPASSGARDHRPDPRPLMPDVPTFAEIGHPEFTARSGSGCL